MTNQNQEKRKIFLRWILLFLCFIGAPFLTRIVCITGQEEAWVRADVAGFISDIGITLIALFLYNALALKSKIASSVIIVLWCLFHYSNYEHVVANGDIVSLTYIGYLFDPTFFLGSAVVVSNKLLTSAIVLSSFSALLIRPVKPSRISGAIIVTLIIALLVARTKFSTIMDPRWRCYNVIQANADDLLYLKLKKIDLTMTDEMKIKYASLLQNDLSGMPFVPLGNKNNNVLLVIVEGCCGGFLSSLDTFQGVQSEITMYRLDSIARHNITYANFITHQRQTNRGTFSILSGTYDKLNSSTPKMTEYVTISNTHKKNNRRFLPGYLKAHGFETTYLQAAPLPYMLKDVFMKRAGFGYTYGTNWFKRYYAMDYWGIDDKSFFEQAFTLIKSKKNLKKPWFITLLTVGTHHPITIPKDYGDPEKESKRTRAFRYLDEALGDFIRKVSAGGILSNTLVIITSDESQGIKEKNYIPAGERICQQWGVCIVLHPQINQGMRVDERYAAADIAVSVVDYLGLPADSVPFMGRSIFRKYDDEREIYFANTYGCITGKFTTDNRLDICRENLHYGEQYSVEPGRLFSFNKKFIRTLTDAELLDMGRFCSISNSSIISPDIQSHTFDFHSGIVHTIEKGPQKNLLAGQYFAIPKDCFVSVRYKGRIVSKDSCVVYLKHDLASNDGKMRIVKYMPREAIQGDTFSVYYEFYCNESYYYSEFRATAELLQGNTAKVILDEASLSFLKRPPTAEEQKKYFRAFDKNVGRDLGAALVIHHR